VHATLQQVLSEVGGPAPENATAAIPQPDNPQPDNPQPDNPQPETAQAMSPQGDRAT